jgi:hypothetical protein
MECSERQNHHTSGGSRRHDETSVVFMLFWCWFRRIPSEYMLHQWCPVCVSQKSWHLSIVVRVNLTTSRVILFTGRRPVVWEQEKKRLTKAKQWLLKYGKTSTTCQNFTSQTFKMHRKEDSKSLSYFINLTEVQMEKRIWEFLVFIIQKRLSRHTNVTFEFWFLSQRL